MLSILIVEKDYNSAGHAWLGIRDSYRTLAELTELEDEEVIDND